MNMPNPEGSRNPVLLPGGEKQKVICKVEDKLALLNCRLAASDDWLSNFPRE